MTTRTNDLSARVWPARGPKCPSRPFTPHERSMTKEPPNRHGAPLLDPDQRRAIRAAREAIGLTRSQLGERCGLAAVTLYQLEAGKGNVRIENLRQLCGVLGLAVDVVIREQTATERLAFIEEVAARDGAAKSWRRAATS